ncbi:5-formyltetrahydrofolate cyclo-ligase isoform X2 [Halyomorpha halys]|nr:5-formyltetrahydrofolate cyclo-ligase isoform X2 [Halyomorpha halys]XP_014278358.1 5-formyltetrahydrofolate cyclo-ligase isoform X2 [Halyomorpha halys]
MSIAAKQLKSDLRKRIKQKLMNLDPAVAVEQSQSIIKQVLSCEKFKQSSRIGIYLSLPEEVPTFSIVKWILNEGKECFIPRYNKVEMRLVKLHSLEDLDALPETSWKIKQPLETEERTDACTGDGLDYIIVPGLAFAKGGDRLGRGKGYYDKYLEELQRFNCERNLRPTYAVGLAFIEQMVDEIPTSEHDFKLNKVFYPI